MANHLMVVLSNAKPGTEDEFNRWYSNVHVLDTINKLDPSAFVVGFFSPITDRIPSERTSA